jgi:hypothetical protein
VLVTTRLIQSRNRRGGRGWTNRSEGSPGRTLPRHACFKASKNDSHDARLARQQPSSAVRARTGVSPKKAPTPATLPGLCILMDRTPWAHAHGYVVPPLSGFTPVPSSDHTSHGPPGTAADPADPRTSSIPRQCPATCRASPALPGNAPAVPSRIRRGGSSPR